MHYSVKLLKFDFVTFPQATQVIIVTVLALECLVVNKGFTLSYRTQRLHADPDTKQAVCYFSTESCSTNSEDTELGHQLAELHMV
jgi:hypothetical protein